MIMRLLSKLTTMEQWIRKYFKKVFVFEFYLASLIIDFGSKPVIESEIIELSSDEELEKRQKLAYNEISGKSKAGIRKDSEVVKTYYNELHTKKSKK